MMLILESAVLFFIDMQFVLAGHRCEVISERTTRLLRLTHFATPKYGKKTPEILRA
jgi:hypothetical protein